MSYWVMLVVFTLLSFTFMALLVLGVYAILQARRAESVFLPTQAIVLSESISEDGEPGGDGLPPVYGPVVEYRYQVGGATYTCSTVFPAGEVKRSRSWAEKVCSRFQVGQSVQAYCNPAEPSEAFLLRGGRLVWWVLVGAGIVGLVFLGAFAGMYGRLFAYLVLVGVALFLAISALLWLSSLSEPKPQDSDCRRG